MNGSLRTVSCGLVCLSLLILSAGCSTHRVYCSPEPATKALTMPDPIRFNLESVKMVIPTNVAAGDLPDFGVIYLNDSERRMKLMERALEVYPKLFADADGSIPLSITVTRSARADKAGSAVCFSCLTLTVYPVPIRESLDYTIEVKSPSAEINQKLAVPVRFTREQEGQMSCFPTGWIPVSGGPGKRVWGSANAGQYCESLMLNSCVNAVVSALQRVRPTAWAHVSDPPPPPAPTPAPAGQPQRP